MDDSQITVPDSFIRLFMPTGHRKPTEPRAVIAERHEFCEDLAQMLTESARLRVFELGITERDVLERTHAGLLAPGAPVSPVEAAWVVRRLAELLDWPALDAGMDSGTAAG